MKSPKQKAEELFEKMLYNDGDKYHHCSHYVGKNCAIIAVDEILNELPEGSIDYGISARRRFFEEVKQEIEKL